MWSGVRISLFVLSNNILSNYKKYYQCILFCASFVVSCSLFVEWYGLYFCRILVLYLIFFWFTEESRERGWSAWSEWSHCYGFGCLSSGKSQRFRICGTSNGRCGGNSWQTKVSYSYSVALFWVEGCSFCCGLTVCIVFYCLCFFYLLYFICLYCDGLLCIWSLLCC